MTRKFKVSDFQKALIIAQADVAIDKDVHDTGNLFGCGLIGFEPVETTIEACALFIRWQAACMNGEWDLHEIELCKHIAKKVFLLK